MIPSKTLLKWKRGTGCIDVHRLKLQRPVATPMLARPVRLEGSVVHED